MAQESARVARCAVAFAAIALASFAISCAPQASRGGAGTATPNMDEAALGVGLDREDINYLVAENIRSLSASKFWTGSVETSGSPPTFAIWPIENRTTQHLEDQLVTILSSIETSLVNSGNARVVARNEQDDLIEEIRRQGSSMYDPRTEQRAGRQLGAKYFVTGRITGVDEKLSGVRRLQYSLFLQVLEVETAQVRWQNEVTRSKQLKR
ncbi:MAG TPA: CsgG/HfaB family protein [Myxococcota bacterium]|nr:CsgG/HfaB family protein [Myxococcota bacterium]